jgi:hypothetical protein
MALDIFFKEDAIRFLASAAANMAATQAANPALDQERAEAYRLGFTDALRAVGLAFGVTTQIAGATIQAAERTIDAPSWRKGMIE